MNAKSFVNGIKRAIYSGFDCNVMEITGDKSRPKYETAHIHSRSEGISTFRMTVAACLMDTVRARPFPERIIALDFGLQQMHGKEEGFNEMIPIIENISVCL